MEVALPPQAGEGGEQRAAALRLEDAHPQDSAPVLQQLLLATADMDRLHERHVSPVVVLQRQVVDGHITVLLVIVVRVFVAVHLMPARVRLVPVVGEDRSDQ